MLGVRHLQYEFTIYVICVPPTNFIKILQPPSKTQLKHFWCAYGGFFKVFNRNMKFSKTFLMQ